MCPSVLRVIFPIIMACSIISYKWVTFFFAKFIRSPFLNILSFIKIWPN